MADALRLRLAPMRLVTPPVPERIALSTLILCYRDRIAARKEGVLRLGDLDALRQEAELYWRDCLELRALVNELDRLEATHVG